MVSRGTAHALNQSIASLSRRLQSVIPPPADPSVRDEAKAIEAALPGLPVVPLRQADFAAGTYRIRAPGRYVFQEDVVFDPPAHDRPTLLHPFPPYQLGFFAAITVESPDVVIDLNGFSLAQSKRHALAQRFHALIELSSSPFDHGQGPSAFGPTVRAANRCVVRNGTLGLSSHHGIHSAGRPTSVVLQDLRVFDFEVAGIHINGATNVHLERVHVGPSRQDVPVMATFSQAVFALPALRSLDSDAFWNGRPASDVARALQDAVDKAKRGDVLPLFKNNPGNTDGNVYGIVIHGAGVVVNGLADQVNESAARNVSLSEVCVEGLVSTPSPVQAMLLGDGTEAYGSGKRVHAGPVGAVMDFSRMVGRGEYRGNALSDAQLLLAKYGRANASDAVLAWAEHHKGSLESLVAKYPWSDPPRDAMDHVMKGSIGVFLSNADTLTVANVMVCDLQNDGEPQASKQYRGADQVGVLLSAVKNVSLENVQVNRLVSRGGAVRGIEARNAALRLANVSVTQIGKGAAMVVDSSSSVRTGQGHLPAMQRR